MLVVMLVLFVPAVIALMFHVDRAHSPGTKRVFLLVYLRHMYVFWAYCVLSCHVLLAVPVWAPISLVRPPCKFRTDYRPAHLVGIEVYFRRQACVCTYLQYLPRRPPRLLGPLVRPLRPLLLTRLCFFSSPWHSLANAFP